MKEAARAQVAGFLDVQGPRDWSFFVRVNPFDTGMTFDNLAAVVKPGLEGLLIPKANSAAHIARIGEEHARLEAQAGMAVGRVNIAVVATETPPAMFALGPHTTTPTRPLE